MKKGKRFAVDIAEVAIFVALMVAASFIAIPFYPVPLTFQTVVSVMAGLLLGWKKGTAAMLVYLFMGLVCFIPVFADHSLAGFAYALKPSFGYIIGFIFSAFTGGIIVSGKKEYSLRRYAVAGIAAFLANYAIGIPYFTVVWRFLFGNAALGGAVVTYNLIYMPKDLILSILAGLLAKRALPVIRKGGERKDLTERKRNKKFL